MTEPVKHADTGGAFRSSAIDKFGSRMLAGLGRLAFPEAVHSRLSILIFHRILDQPDPLLPFEITAHQFASEMALLAANFSIIPMHEGLARLREGTLPPFSLCITFDDGYRDNYSIAMPVLKSLGIKATFFVASGYLESGRMWNDTLLEIVRHWPADTIDLSDWGVPKIPMTRIADRQEAWALLFKWMRKIGDRGRTEMLERLANGVHTYLPTDLMLTRDQVRQLHSEGMEIGCHTCSHPILTRVSQATAEREIVGSRRDLEDLTQAPVRYFAYPNGVPGDDYGIRDVEIVKNAGFDAAFTTSWGVATRDWDRYQMPRYTPWGRSLTGFTIRLIQSRMRMTPTLVSEGAV